MLQKPNLFRLAVGTAADLWQAFWVVYAAFSLEYFCCQSGESYENVGDDENNIVNIFSDE